MTFFKRFLSTLVCAGLLTACNGQPDTRGEDNQRALRLERSQIPAISVQLWSVNHTLKKDFKGTLEAISAMGFDAVEFAGDFGPYHDDPQGLKRYLKSLDLQVSGAHVKMRELTDEKFEQTVTFYQQLGSPMLIVPSDKRAEQAETIEAFVTELNKVSAKMRAKGMRFGFHNHDRELVPYKNSTYWDYIAANTAEDFVLQLDVGWAEYSGKDPVAYINRYPNRTITTHFKAKYPAGTYNKKPLIGQDITDWPAVIYANVKKGGTQWLVLEQEEYPDGLTQLEAVQVSKKGLDNIITQLTN
ncbi:sugar phosphate isomerase/epimerase [Pseudoalteromonas sp. DL2-H2.2]|uniref:sugar phosphate isomerase/epimerase family protein n=1 Tax=Pseudoalteromonas sp. DL2-H2.2 TaxID=2908889 RepID=UPI001F18A7D4|nr:sugar phosphate isomerase/epimerase [Pseudoalteromonas sp. DL2-H2.2]MCF2909349.1 sugar phosphate isomerase/epimerase [Pseudoalteromonas sp. DL2-H2.2]